MGIADIIMSVIGSVAKIGMDAYAASQQTEAELLARLEAVLAEASASVAARKLATAALDAETDAALKAIAVNVDPVLPGAGGGT